MKNLKRILKYLKKYRLYAILAPTLIILEVIMELVQPNMMSDIINNGVAKGDIKYVIVNSLIMFGLTLVGVAGGLGSSYFAAKASENVTADLREEVFTKISKLSFLNLEKIKPGHLLTVLTNDITTIGGTLMMGLRILFRVPVIFIGSLIMSFFISFKLALILIILIPVVFSLVIFILRKAFPYFNKIQGTVDDMNSTVRENVGGIRVVKSFTTEEMEIQRFDNTNKKLMVTTLKGVKWITIAMPVMMLSVNLATVLVLWFGGKLTVSGELLVGDILAFTQYTANILTSVLMASMTFMMASRSLVSAQRIVEVLDEKEDFKNKKDSKTIENMQGEIEFKNVSFSYENGAGDSVLKDISFKINPGERVAIIGAIGSGKTTLANLIPRFYDTTAGDILLDGVSVKDIDIKFLRKNIGYSFQQPFIFSKTIRENICFGVRDASTNALEAASKISAAQEFIGSKENKYEYVLEQRGANLSGGQKQRISIARSIITNPKILIFDDSTSAVDVKTAKAIKKALEENQKCTTLIITSRISEALDADRVIVLDDGALVGFDTPEKLLKENKYYQDIYNSQLKEEK